MELILKPVHEQIVVITEANNGIGIETAKRLLQLGAKVVVAAPDEEQLHILGRKLDSHGVVVYVKADATHERDVERIANSAHRTFGGFDAWVNLTREITFSGNTLDLKEADLKELGDLNFWCVVFGSRVAARKFLRDEHPGTIVNVGNFQKSTQSISKALYLASRNAIKGWTDGLREELEKNKIAVSLIQPSKMPLDLSNATANRNQFTVEEVAGAILYCLSNRKEEVLIGTQSRFTEFLNNLFDDVSSDPNSRGSDLGKHSLNEKPINGTMQKKTSKYPILSTIVFAGIGAGLWMFNKKKRN